MENHEPAASATDSVVSLTLARPGRVHGTVVEPVSDALLRDVEVRLVARDYRVLLTARTGPDGAFSFEPVPIGAYQLLVTPAFGFLPSTPLPIEVGSGETLERTLPLEAAMRLSGRVVDEATGTALASVGLRVLDRSGRIVRRGVSTPTGHYEFANLPRGTYTVAADPDA